MKADLMLRSRPLRTTMHGSQAVPPGSAARPIGEQQAAHAAQARLGRVRTAERIALVAVDFLAVNLAFYVAWFLRYRLNLITDIEPGSYVSHTVYYPMQVSLALLFVSLAAMRRLYAVPRAATALEDAGTYFTLTGLSLMAVFAGSTFVHYPAESRLTLIFAWVLVPIFLTLARSLALSAMGELHRRGIGVARTLVVGNNLRGRMILQSLDGRPHLGFQIVGYLDDDALPFGRFRCLGSAADLERIVGEERIAHVVIALPSTERDAIVRIVDHCRRDGVEFRLVPDLYELSLGRMDVDSVSGIPLMGLKRTSISGLNFVVKRAIDVLGALAVLVIGSPVYLGVALAIKLEDPGGPIFFCQTRVGQEGKHFACWKFRSMRRDADHLLTQLLDKNEAEGPIFKMRDDPRCTRVGRFIRRFSLDELPQFWNVLRGDMSLVGPRPPTPREVALYEDWHHDRLAALPGITGLWQISGRSELGFTEQVMLDITYIENWSLGLDLRILLRTIPAVLTGRGAF